jgi:protein involved in ribonucleotide reduction
MLIIYDSKTGNVRRFINKLNMECLQVKEDLVVDAPFILITYTTGFGDVPLSTLNFLEYNHKYLRGVAASGNRNWGFSFAKSAKKISEKYSVPILLEFELSGLNSDVEKITYEIRRLDESKN